MRYVLLLLLLATCTEPNETEPDPEMPENDFAELIEQRTAYMVEYEITSGIITGSRMIEYVDGERHRTDMHAEGLETRIYNDQTTHSCTRLDEWRCEQSDTDTQIAPINTETIERQPGEITQRPPQTIAGTQATCFQVTYRERDTEYCLSPEGIPLLARSLDPSQRLEMRATRYTTSIPPGTFDLPADPHN